jgi:hypothetical protein
MSEKLDCSPSGIEATKKEIVSFRKSQGSDGGKGSCPRSCFSEAYRENYDAIFGRSRRQVDSEPVE